LLREHYAGTERKRRSEDEHSGHWFPVLISGNYLTPSEKLEPRWIATPDGKRSRRFSLPRRAVNNGKELHDFLDSCLICD
jgi:hypothetical protein